LTTSDPRYVTFQPSDRGDTTLIDSHWRAGVIFAAAAFVGPFLAIAQESPYASAEFSVSSDPANLILLVQGYSTSVDVTDSLRLFGDGRLELAVSGRLPEPERRQLMLTEAAKEELVAIAVRHGLAEWDTSRIESEKSILLNSRQMGTSDGYVLTVTLALESYRRGSFERADVVKKMSVASPDLAMEYFPGLPEFRGLFELQKYMQRLMDSEGLHP